VIAERDEKGNIYYQAQSPDESALVDGARVNGFEFRDTGLASITTCEMGEEKQYEVLANMEFTSDRARSSVILRDSENKITLYSKGSDAQMLRRLGRGGRNSEKGEQVYQAGVRHLDEFSNLGLRTLIVARRKLTQEEFDEWNKKYHEAATSLNNRTEAVNTVSTVKIR